MTTAGTLLRIIGAAILLIVVQFASVAANAHAGHGHGQHLQGQTTHGHALHEHASAVGNAEVEAAFQNAPGTLPSDSDTCVMGCCGCTGCCAAALAVVSPHLPPKACSPRIGFARAVAVPGVDPRGLRKPPRSLA